MVKKCISAILALCLMLGLSAVSFAAQGGNISDDLRWSYVENDGLHILGSGTSIPDYEEGAAPWSAVAKNIYQLYLPATIEHIGSFAFAGCANLKQAISLGSAVTSIGEGAFKDCGITAITIPYGVSQIAPKCFYGCENLTSVTYQVRTTGGMGTTHAEGVSVIGNNAFEFCTELASLSTVYVSESATKTELPSTLTAIGKEAFSQCGNLSSVSFADSGKAVKSIGVGAFMNCESLTAFSVPTGMSTIEESTFFRTGLLKIKLASNVTAIEQKAFAYCYDLKTIEIYNEACTIADVQTTTPDGAKLVITAKAANILAYAEKYAKPLNVLCIGRGSHRKAVKTLVKASTKQEGRLTNACPDCGYGTVTRIPQIKEVKLTKTKFVYTGKKQIPAAYVRVTDAAGKVIDAANYTVTAYVKSNCKTVGQQYITITFKGNYEGSVNRGFYIIPKGTAIKSITPGKGMLKLTWTKQTTQTTGYQIRLCKNTKFASGVKLYTIKNNKTVSGTIKKLSRKTGYYLQIRTYRTVSGKHYFSEWSKTVGKKTK